MALVTQEQLYGKIVSNIVEVKTRGAFVLAVTNEDNKDIEKMRIMYSIFRKQIKTLPD